EREARHDRRGQVEEQVFARTKLVLDLPAEPPQEEHVAGEVPDGGVEEGVAEQAPDLSGEELVDVKDEPLVERAAVFGAATDQGQKEDQLNPQQPDGARASARPACEEARPIPVVIAVLNAHGGPCGYGVAVGGDGKIHFTNTTCGVGAERSSRAKVALPT